MNATVVSDRVLHVSAIGARLIMAVGGAYCPTVLGERFPRHPAASVAHHDAPLIGERAATRGRSAMEGGGERAVVKRASSSSIKLANRVTRREPRAG